MAPPLGKPDDTQEGHEGWTFVELDASSGERSPQYNNCNISSSQKGTYTTGNDLSGLTTEVDHPKPDEAKGIYVHPIRVQHPEFKESMTAGPTSSTPDNDDLQSPSLIPHLEPCPLKFASLNDHNIPWLTKDIQAWASGEHSYWRLPATDDHASIQPLVKGTTRHSTNGSSCLLMLPLQPSNVEQDLLGAGSSFDGALFYSNQLEFD